jgi:uncharacterized OB-fold protein
MSKPQKPAIEGWFTTGGNAPSLLGTRCRSCKTFFFPKETYSCRNPRCGGKELEQVPLSRRGTLWSYTNNCYPPPPPYVASEPFEPYALAAVELAEEKMVVLGQVVPGVLPRDLKVGMAMEMVVEPLYEDDQTEYLIWKWKPAGQAAR